MASIYRERKKDKKMLFDRITERDNEFFKYCDGWNGQKICLFGAGEGAYRIFNYLKKRQIEVTRIAVSQDYLDVARNRLSAIWGGYCSENNII